MQKDISQKRLESYNDVFADIVNVLLFNGRQVVTEDSLIEAESSSSYKDLDDFSQKLHSQDRDVVKFWHNGEIRLSLFGLENQTKREKTMPLRIINYDASAYRSQLLKSKKRSKNQKFYPVVTLVLYFGTKSKWSKNLSLKEVVEIPSELQNFVNDYKINVFNLAWLSEEQIALFKSDFREVVDYLRCERLDIPFKGSKRKLDHVFEMLDLFSALTNNDIYKIAKSDIINIQSEQGGLNMMSLAEKMMRERENSAIDKIVALFTKFRADGKDEEIDKALKDREYLKKLMDEYQK